MKSILALAIVLLSNIAISCTSNQKIYEEFISTNISLPFSRMEQIGGDSIWNKDSELTHIVSIDSKYPSEKSRLFSDGYFATGKWKGTAIMLTTGCAVCLMRNFLTGHQR